MINSRPLNVNLASHPLRNRRFFFLVFSVLVVLLLVTSFFAGKIFIRFRSEAQHAKDSIRQTERLIRDTQREEKGLTSKINEAVKKDKSYIDLVNSIILKKSFSWIEFFADLEKSLPDSSYIVSLAPTLSDDSDLRLRLRVACLSVNDLLKLIDNLIALEFSKIQIEGETQNERGLLISEISVSYERTF
jgi:hypothetical protein